MTRQEFFKIYAYWLSKAIGKKVVSLDFGIMLIYSSERMNSKGLAQFGIELGAEKNFIQDEFIYEIAIGKDEGDKIWNWANEHQSEWAA